MPYNPAVSPDTTSIAGGISTAGLALAQGLQRFSENKQKMGALDASFEIFKQAHPDLVSPEIMEKFSKGGLGQKQGMIGELTAGVVERYKDRLLTNDTAKLGLEATRIGEGARQFNEREQNDVLSAAPRFFPKPVGGALGIIPKTGQLVPEAKGAIPEPGEKWTDHTGPDGKIVAKSRWNPYKGETEIIRLTGSSDPFAALGAPNVQTNGANAGTGGLPAGGATRPGGQGAQAGNPILPQGAVSQIKTADDYNALPAGAKYLDPNGVLRTKR